MNNLKEEYYIDTYEEYFPLSYDSVQDMVNEAMAGYGLYAINADGGYTSEGFIERA